MCTTPNPFDQKARSWDDPSKIKRAQDVARIMEELIPLSSDWSAFEYGCGTGLLTFELASKLRHITAADSSAGMLEVLKEKIASSAAQNIDPVKMDMMTDPLPNTTFNFIYSMLTLHHLPDTQLILADFFQILTSPGYLCIVDLDKEDGSFHGDGFTGHHGFDRSSLQATVESIGFRNVQYRTVFAIEKPCEHGCTRQYNAFLLVARK